MRRATTPILLVAALLAAAAPAAAAGLPDTLELNYQLHYGDILAGQTRKTLARQPDGGYRHRTHSLPAGMAKLFTSAEWIEEGAFRVRTNQVQAQSFLKYREGGSKPRRHSVTFDWAKKLARYGDGREEPLPANAHDEASVLYELMLNPPPSDKTARSVAINNGKRFVVYRYQTLGREPLDTPLGRLQTLKIKRLVDPAASCRGAGRDSDACKPDSELTLWLAVERGNLPVKIHMQEGDREATLTLQAVTGL
ncbi:MAG: hypothetical protein A2150_04365 [Candidatus Muproteobacteria bacterium RBG_16_64_11]|uniref:DUF3108 domain-containing protein n=1 Tax=Candidatus Muproteobacteria bacterium RBG_16_64_11 TaxID=1817758 RepID=A0A1F6TE59_9PROT|nr:MAG: hypothetical protein A2150_04365 [Candidatus Muproteobacteria bacterium RBG_16_64_11]